MRTDTRWNLKATRLSSSTRTFGMRSYGRLIAGYPREIWAKAAA